MASSQQADAENCRSHVENHVRFDSQVVYPQPLRQRAGNEPGLMYSTGDIPPTNVNVWFQSLPQSFPDSSEGFVGELISLCKELFAEVQHTVGGREGSQDLHGLQQSFAIWVDQKDRLDVRLNGAPDMRTRIVCDLVALIVILSSGLDPSRQQARLPVTRRVIEQASRVAGEYIEQSMHYTNTDLAEYIQAASNAIQSRLDNLRSLSPTIDCWLEDHDAARSRDEGKGNAVTREEIPPAVLNLFEERFPNAPDHLVSICFAAHCQRVKDSCSSHPEVEVHLNSSNGSDDVEAPHSSTSKPKTGRSSSSSRSFLDPSLASELSSRTNAQSDTAPTSLSSEANLFSVGQSTSSGFCAGRRLLECSLCNEKAKDLADHRKHQLLHMPTYHCCFENCEDVPPLFSNIQEWFDHEFQNHRVHIRWNCSYCHDIFDQPTLYMDHLSQAHGKQRAYEPTEMTLENSRVKLPKAVQEEQCIFCCQSAFKNRGDYELHVGGHMEEVASLIVSSLIPAPRYRLLDVAKFAHWVFRFCGRVSQIPRLLYDFLKANIRLGVARACTDEDLKERMRIWDNVRKDDFLHWAFLDTGADGNFMRRSVVEQRSLEIHPLVADWEDRERPRGSGDWVCCTNMAKQKKSHIQRPTFQRNR